MLFVSRFNPVCSQQMHSCFFNHSIKPSLNHAIEDTLVNLNLQKALGIYMHYVNSRMKHTLCLAILPWSSMAPCKQKRRAVEAETLYPVGTAQADINGILLDF